MVGRKKLNEAYQAMGSTKPWGIPLHESVGLDSCEKLARKIEGIMAEAEHRPTKEQLQDNVVDMLSKAPWTDFKDTPEAREAVSKVQARYRRIIVALRQDTRAQLALPEYLVFPIPSQ